MAIQLPDNPSRADLLAARPTLWINPNYKDNAIGDASLPVRPSDIDEAHANWRRLASLLEACFPELKPAKGEIRSDLVLLDEMRDALGYDSADFGTIFVKADNALPVPARSRHAAASTRSSSSPNNSRYGKVSCRTERTSAASPKPTRERSSRATPSLSAAPAISDSVSGLLLAPSVLARRFTCPPTPSPGRWSGCNGSG